MTQPTKYPLWDTNQTATSDPGAARELDGWLAPAGVPEKPPYQTFNHWQNNVYLWLKYFNEQGVADWDTTITYAIGAYVVATDKKLYRALVSQAGNTPVGDAVNWQPVGDLINTLVSTDTTRGLTAAQGKVLKDVQDTLVGLAISATETAKGFSFIRKRIVGSNGTDAAHDIDTIAGNFKFADGSGSANIGAFTKQIDATWAQGSAAGGLAAGVHPVSNNTTYHYFALSNSDGSIVDFGFDTSITAAGLVADAAVIAALGASAKYERQFSVITDGSANILPFTQLGKRFQWTTRVTDIDSTDDPGNTGTLFPLTVPSGIKVLADISIHWTTGGSRQLLITSPEETNSVVSLSFCTLASNASIRKFVQCKIKTDTSGRLRSRANSAGVATDYYIFTLGWIDETLDD